MNKKLQQASSDHRQEGRLDEIAAVFIEWMAGAEGLEGASQTAVILCSSADLSSHGLRVSTDRALPVGAILTLGVELKKTSETLFLAGEVRWCEHDSSGRYQIGFQVLQAEDSDHERWQDVVTTLNMP